MKVQSSENKLVNTEEFIFDQNKLPSDRNNHFNIGFYAYAIIGHTRADQLLPQLLMEQFDTFPMQCRHIEHMHEGVWFRKNNF